MSGEYTLVELSKIETNPLRKSVIDALLMEVSVMEIIQWETIGALSTAVTRLGTLPSVGFRKLNEGYASGRGSLEQKVEHIHLFGGYFDVDKAMVRASNTIANIRAIAQIMHLKAIAYSFNNFFINGNPQSDPDEFKGIKQRIADLVAEGYTGQYVDNAGTAGDGILLSSSESFNFLDRLDDVRYNIKGHNPPMAFMNSKMLKAYRSLLRREKLLDNSKDMFDRPVDIHDGTKLIDIGTTSDQLTNIITSTETLEDAGAPESTSIYFVKPGIGEYFWGIQEYPMEVEDLGRLESAPIYRTEFDWPVGLADVDPYCLGRLYGIIPDAST